MSRGLLHFFGYALTPKVKEFDLRTVIHILGRLMHGPMSMAGSAVQRACQCIIISVVERIYSLPRIEMKTLLPPSLL